MEKNLLNFLKVLIGQKETLPNIKGTYWFARNQWTGTPQCSSATGALNYHSSDNGYFSAQGGQNTGFYDIDIDASKYSDVYKDNAEVKSKNISLKNWLRIS